ncbi:MAG: hypothetical protein LBJ64_01230 [Deltaproteobacteria bacterium]|jgi:hypothetical protein|nr:hypothetical protein [Deltaproteobacteria bacterium]
MTTIKPGLADSQKAIAASQKAVGSILEALRVDCVINVDDANKEFAVEDVVIAALAIDTALLAPIFPELGLPLPEELDILTENVTTAWRDLTPENKLRRGKQVIAAARRQDGKVDDDLVHASILDQIIPEGKLVSLSPEQWEQEKSQRILDCTTQRTLFLIDQVFSDAADRDSQAGIKIITSLLKNDATENIFCGLLTHTVTPEEQPEEWESLSKKYRVSRDRFTVIPKLHLIEDPMLFAQILKVTALSSDLTNFKLKARDILGEAAANAAKRVEDLDIYALERIVLQVSASEGLWEPDMLFRLHAMFHRMESRRLAYEGGALESIAAKLRKVSGIPTKCELLPVPLNTWSLQREELYELDEHVNNNHLPLELGDIFEKAGGNSQKKYILLAQPCDLMVRQSGNREPTLSRVPLAEIVLAEDEKEHYYADEMPYFDKSPDRKWLAKFRRIKFVHICILDLCVFNEDGVAKLFIDAPAPDSIRPTWKERHKYLLRHWKPMLDLYDLSQPKEKDSAETKNAKKAIAKKLNLFDDDLFKGGINEENGAKYIQYNCKRIGRLSRERAMGLLMSFTSTLGRPAYDRDFVD